MKYTKPVMVIFGLFILYVVYTLFFAESKDIFDLTKLNPDDNKNVDVRLYLSKDYPVQIDPIQNISTFYVKDKNGITYKVQGPENIPDGFKDATIVVLRGHRHHDYFHAVSIQKFE